MSLTQIHSAYANLLEAPEMLMALTTPVSRCATVAYTNNWLGALQDAITACYPLCLKVVGENTFKQLAKAYVRKHPLLHNDLNLYGSEFSRFIQSESAKQPALLALDYLPLLAQTEAYLQQSYYASARVRFNTAGFIALDEEQRQHTQLHVAGDIRLVCAPFNIQGLVSWLSSDLFDSTQYSLQEEPFYAIVERPEVKPIIRVIGKQDWYTLLYISSGLDLLAVCDTLWREHQVVANFTTLLTQGWVDRFEQPTRNNLPDDDV